MDLDTWEFSFPVSTVALSLSSLFCGTVGGSELGSGAFSICGATGAGTGKGDGPG